jgi:DNA adenine methylase
MSRLRSPIGWFGGKGNMVAKLLPLLPQHEQYVEPFFGGGSVFFAKDTCPHETINDADEGVTGFFRVLRDKGEEFIARAQLTEYGELLFNDCRDTWREEGDELLRAWKWWVVARQSFSGRFGEGHGHTRTNTNRGMAGPVSGWLSGIDSLPLVVERLRGTQILCGDALRALRCCDTPDCFAYLDPPYVASTRSAGGYAHEMDDAAHAALVEYLLTEWTGKAVLSGYRHAVHEPLEAAGWRRLDFGTACYAAGRTRGTGLLGEGAALAKQARTESVWLCPRTAREVLAEHPQLDLAEVAGA